MANNFHFACSLRERAEIYKVASFTSESKAKVSCHLDRYFSGEVNELIYSEY